MIRASLSLAVRLIDTTTGRAIGESDVRFYRGDSIFPYMTKGEFRVFTNEGREDFLMRVCARGYDEEEIPICYGELDPKLPTRDIFLMPSENNRTGGMVLSIHGTLSKLQSIEAVMIDRPLGLFHSMTEKKEVFTMNVLPKTPGGGVRLDTMRYALLNENRERYEVFEVTEELSPTSVRIKERLTEEHKTGDTICRIIYGRVSKDGSYVLKVREDASSLPVILHFMKDGREYFKRTDLMEYVNGADQADLLKGAAVKETITPKENKEDE